MKTITIQELKNRIAEDIGLHVWNVTTDQYFKGEVIPGSRHIPVDRLPEALKKASVAKDAAIVVYCAGPKCPASKSAAEQLAALGYTDVAKFAGGIEEWKQAGYGVSGCETGTCSTAEATCSTTEKKSVCGSC